ncbi:type II toxin-antitoxin system RelE/ParE family toxin [soil metagenome]
MRLVWTRPALADVVHIRDYIAADSPRYARVVAERIVASVDRLRAFPLSGRVVPELNDPVLREVIDPPYRIVHRVRDDVLEILTVVHSSRDFPTEFLRAKS